MLDKMEFTLVDNNEEITFIISKMPATKMQITIAKALSLIKTTGKADIEADIKTPNVNNFLELLQGLDIDKAIPIINSLYTCVQRKTDKGGLIQVTENNIDSIITDVKNLFTLQSEVVKYNLSFLQIENSQNTEASPQTTKNSYNMKTSRRK